MTRNETKTVKTDETDKSAVIVIASNENVINTLSMFIPKERMEDVFHLDFGWKDFIIPYNPLDTRENDLSAQEAAQLVFDTWKSLWSSNWNALTEATLKYALLAIAAHNANTNIRDADGLSILGMFLTSNDKSRKAYLNEIQDPYYKASLLRYFDNYRDYNPKMIEQIIMPILSKSYLFEESPMLEFFSSRSWFDPSIIIRDKGILLVNTRMGDYDPDITNFFSSIILKAILKQISCHSEDLLKADDSVLLIIDDNLSISDLAVKASNVCNTIRIDTRSAEKSKQYEEVMIRHGCGSVPKEVAIKNANDRLFRYSKRDMDCLDIIGDNKADSADFTFEDIFKL